MCFFLHFPFFALPSLFLHWPSFSFYLSLSLLPLDLDLNKAFSSARAPPPVIGRILLGVWPYLIFTVFYHILQGAFLGTCWQLYHFSQVVVPAGMQLLMCLAKFAFEIFFQHLSHFLVSALFVAPPHPAFLWFNKFASCLKIWLQILHLKVTFWLDTSCIRFLCITRPALLLQTLWHPSTSQIRLLAPCWTMSRWSRRLGRA